MRHELNLLFAGVIIGSNIANVAAFAGIGNKWWMLATVALLAFGIYLAVKGSMESANDRRGYNWKPRSLLEAEQKARWRR